jgi:hypothetical protein
MDDSPAPFIVFKPNTTDVYQIALELVGQVHDILEKADSTRYHLKDRLDRNTTALTLALAHAADEPVHVRWKGYRHALRLVTETATLLDILARQGCAAIGSLAQARETIEKLQTELAPLSLHGN